MLQLCACAVSRSCGRGGPRLSLIRSVFTPTVGGDPNLFTFNQNINHPWGMSSEEWDTLDDAMADKLMLTDVAFVSDKKKPPQDYEVVSCCLRSLSS